MSVSMDAVRPPQGRGTPSDTSNSAGRWKKAPAASVGIVHWTMKGTAALVAAFALAGCVHVPLRERAAFRLAEYFEGHREVAPSVAEAMQRGHVTLGMDEAQVIAVLGEPVRRVQYGGPRVPQVWIYRGYKLHQGYAHGASLYRFVFLDGRLRVLEPI